MQFNTTWNIIGQGLVNFFCKKIFQALLPHIVSGGTSQLFECHATFTYHQTFFFIFLTCKCLNILQSFLAHGSYNKSLRLYFFLSCSLPTTDLVHWLETERLKLATLDQNENSTIYCTALGKKKKKKKKTLSLNVSFFKGTTLPIS